MRAEERESTSDKENNDMPMISVTHKGDITKTIKTFRKMRYSEINQILDKYGAIGVEELRKATPKDTGKTSESWGYKIQRTQYGSTIIWTNSNINKYANVEIGKGMFGNFLGVEVEQLSGEKLEEAKQSLVNFISINEGDVK